LLGKVPVDRIKEFEEEFLNFMEEKHHSVLEELKSGKIHEGITDVLEDLSHDLSLKYKTK
jgi:F-type H+-transporting ATPase subunit alpha